MLRLPRGDGDVALPISVYRDLIIRCYKILDGLEPGTPEYDRIAFYLDAYRLTHYIFNQEHRN